MIFWRRIIRVIAGFKLGGSLCVIAGCAYYEIKEIREIN